MDQQRVNRRVAEILQEHGTQHAQHRAVATRVVTHGVTIARHDDEIREHAEAINGLAADVGSILDDGGLIHQQNEVIAQVTAGLAGERQNREATDERVGRVERRLNRIDGEFPWIFWGGISAIGFLLSMLFWRVVMYGSNWHPWLADRGGPEYWQNHNPGVLNAHWWILVLVTTGLIAGIAWIILSFVGRGGQQNNTANTTEPTTTRQAEEVEVVHVGPFGPAGTAPVAPEPPAGHTDTSVFSPDQQPALR